jgi:hypothetical protein
MRIGEPSSRDQARSYADAFDSKVSSPPRRCCQYAEYSSRISDLENRLTLAKRQAQMTIDKASKTCGLMKRISILDNEVSGLMAKVVHHEECDSFVIGIIESACKMLRCKIPCNFSFFHLFHCCSVMSFVILGTCLDFAAEARQVAERNTALEKHQRVLTVCGLILDAVALSYCSRTAPSISENQLMVSEELS